MGTFNFHEARLSNNFVMTKKRFILIIKAKDSYIQGSSLKRQDHARKMKILKS